MRRLAPFALALALAAACGGTKGTLSVNVLVPVGDDPFAQATQAVITVGDPPVAQQIVPVSGGRFTASIEMKLKRGQGIAGAVYVEARDGSGRILGYGRTPLLALLPVDESVTVWVGRPGRAGVSAATLAGRAALTAGPIPRLGAVFIGGRDASGLVSTVEIYHGFTHSIISGERLPVARASAVAIGYDRLGATTGAVLIAGGLAGDAAAREQLLGFDPVAVGTSAGRWQSLRTDAALARVAPASAETPGGGWLLAGGSDPGGVPLASAVELSIGSQLGVITTQLMTTARAGAVALGGQYGGQDGALVIGGSAAGAHFLERYIGSTRSFEPVSGSDALAPRSGFTATRLPDNRVVVAGGSDGQGGAPLASGIVLTPGTPSFREVAALLPAPRARHVAFVAGGELILCGGVDGAGVATTSCDALDPATLSPRRSFTLANPRADLVAVPLETGDILLAGGVDRSGNPVTALELYTPSR